MPKPQTKEIVLEGRTVHDDGTLGNDQQFHEEWMGTTPDAEQEDLAALKERVTKPPSGFGSIR